VAGRIDIVGSSNVLSWAVAGRAKVSGHSGDGYTLLRDGEDICAVVIDGLGSGAEAHQAATIGLRAVQQRDCTSLEHMFASAHESLRRVRGAAMAAVSVSLRTMSASWAAVGDVDGLHLRCGMPNGGLIQRSGTLGVAYDGIRVIDIALEAGDVLVLTTDGVRRSYRGAPMHGHNVQAQADTILETYCRPSDDCLALVLKVEATR